jgi:hypothetical protein
MQRERHLPHVVQAARAGRSLPRALDGRQDEADEETDYADDHQGLD